MHGTGLMLVGAEVTRRRLGPRRCLHPAAELWMDGDGLLRHAIESGFLGGICAVMGRLLAKNQWCGFMLFNITFSENEN